MRTTVCMIVCRLSLNVLTPERKGVHTLPLPFGRLVRMFFGWTTLHAASIPLLSCGGLRLAGLLGVDHFLWGKTGGSARVRGIRALRGGTNVRKRPLSCHGVETAEH